VCTGVQGVYGCTGWVWWVGRYTQVGIPRVVREAYTQGGSVYPGWLGRHIYQVGTLLRRAVPVLPVEEGPLRRVVPFFPIPVSLLGSYSRLFSLSRFTVGLYSSLFSFSRFTVGQERLPSSFPVSLLGKKGGLKTGNPLQRGCCTREEDSLLGYIPVSLLGYSRKHR